MTESWNILGAGAIGSLMACKLARAGIPACLLHRQSGSSDGQTIELIEEGCSSQFSVTRVPVQQLDGSGISRLLLTTKAHQALAAFLDIRAHLDPAAIIVLLHNGMGVYEQLSEHWNPAQLFCATTTEGAYLAGPNQLVYAGRGETRLGQAGLDCAPAWFNGLGNSGEHFYWSRQIDTELWRKLLINCAINPLTAIHRCRNGELLENPQWRAQAQLVCEELAAVSLARGYPQLAEEIQEQAFAVMHSTAANQSSMLQDVLQGRTTENEYITAYLCQQARQLDVPCPANQKLLVQMRQLDTSQVDT